MVYNRIPVAFGAVRRITGPTISYQYDVTQVLVISGIDLPEYYVVDFCNEGDATVIPMTGTSDGVEIPDALLRTGKAIKAYIVVSGGQGDVQTRYEVKLPVNNRPMRDDVHPTDAQQQQIDALVDALNDGVSRAETAAAMLEDVSAEAETLEPGQQATAEYDEGVFRFGIPEGEKGDPFTYEDFTEEQKAELVQGPILEAQTNAVNAVNSAGTTQKNAVNTAGTTKVNAVNQAGTTQVSAVNQAGTTQVNAVNTAGTTQVNAVQAKGEEVIGSIPPDYSNLADDVVELNNAISNLQPAATSSDVGKALIVKTVADGKPTSYEYGDAGSGLNETAKALLINILKAGIYTTDQSSNIIALKNALDEGGGGGGEVTVTQVGTALIFSGVSAISNVTQNGTTLVLT